MTKQPNMTAHQSLPAATGNLINPTVTPTYPPVIPDLIGDLRACGLTPGASGRIRTDIALHFCGGMISALHKEGWIVVRFRRNV